MKDRGGKQAEIADMVVVQVRDDHVLHRAGIDAQELQALVGRGDHPSPAALRDRGVEDRKSTRLNSSHLVISYAVFCLKKKNKHNHLSDKRTLFRTVDAN